MKTLILLTFLGFGICFLFPFSARAAVTVSSQMMDYPSDAGLIDVTKAPYFAVGNGQTDDTAALQRAIADNAEINGGAYGHHNHILYFPAGTYLVHDTLAWKGPAGWAAFLSFWGESESKSIIKLAPNAPGFSDPTNPKAVIATASQFSTSPDGSGNNAFFNNISNITVNVGSANPGAKGIDWVASNVAFIRNVLVTSDDGGGFSGIDCTRGAGPALIKNVTIQGFQYGLKDPDGLTIEHLSLQHQKTYGILLNDNFLAIRDLESTNSVPVLYTSLQGSFVTLIDGTFNGGSPSTSALIFDNYPLNTQYANFYLRNVTSSGYQSLLNYKKAVVSGTSFAEYTTMPATGTFPSSATALHLPIQETPEYDDSNLANWTNAANYQSDETTPGDIGQALQAAIDHSGASTIYLPWGVYQIGSTVHIHGSVHEIIGFGTILIPLSAGQNPSPVFQVDSGAANPVVFQNWDFDFLGQTELPYPTVLDASQNTLVVRDVSQLTYDNVPGAGSLFLENVADANHLTNKFRFHNQTVWARQLNPECANTSPPYCTAPAKVENYGGTLWVLGEKSEGRHYPSYLTNGGGKLELLGAYFLTNPDAADSPGPLFVSQDSSQSLAYRTDGVFDWAIQVQETQNGVTKDFDRLRNVYNGTAMPLYVNSPAASSLVLQKSATPTSAQSGDHVIFTINYKNTSNTDATHVVITDAIPVGSTLLAGSITAGGTLTGNTINWNLGVVAAMATGSVSFQVTVN